MCCNTPTKPKSKGGKKPAKCTKASCPLICPTKVEFKEDSGSTYGFDNHTNVNIPWKSVEKGKTDTVEVVVTPVSKFSDVKFTSSDTSKVTITPSKATSGKFNITVSGINKGEATVKATCGGTELGKMKVNTYAKKTKTVAVRRVHEKNYTSTNLSDADIKSFLKKVYKQAIFEFTVTRLPAKTVEFDLNKDGKVDVDSWMSAEMIKIRDACKDTSYDYNIFLVDNPSDGSFGFMDFNQRYGFVHVDQTSSPEKSFVHELGHGAFGLQHKNTDLVNNMSQGDSASKWRLRKDQWDKINP